MTHLDSEHVLHTRSYIRALHELLHSGEINIQMAASLLDVKQWARDTDASRVRVLCPSFRVLEVVVCVVVASWLFPVP